MNATEREQSNRRLLRARDAMDRDFGDALDIQALADGVHLSRAHFIRTFKETFGETPHRYLQRRRIERAMSKLRESDKSVSDICLDVGFTSLGTFSRTFRDIVGISPTEYRARTRDDMRARIPSCVVMAYDRPSSTFGEDKRASGS